MGVLEIFDGFDYYSGSQKNQRWDSDSNTSAGMTSTTAFSYGQAASLSNSQTMYLRPVGTGNGRGVLSQSATKVVGCRVGTFGNSSFQNNFIFQFIDAATIQMEVWFNTSGNLVVKRNGTTLATSSQTLLSSAYYYVEFVVTINSSTGSYSLIVDAGNGPVTWLTASGINTSGSGNAWTNGFILGGSGTFGGTSYDDFYIRSDSTTYGDSRVFVDEPNADGDTDQWAPNSGANTWSRVNSNDGDTSYISDSTLNDLSLVKYPSYASNGGTTKAVQIVACCRKDDATVRDIKPEMKSGGTVFDGPDSGGLTTSYAYFPYLSETDPATSAAWGDSGVSNLQGGVKVSV